MPLVLFKLKMCSWAGGGWKGLGVLKQSVIVNLACFDAGHAVRVQIEVVFVLLDRGR